MNKCCEKCLTDFAFRPGTESTETICLLDYDCPCHHNPPMPEWMIEFDKKFGSKVGGPMPVGLLTDIKIKAFIQSEVVERMIQRIPPAIMVDRKDGKDLTLQEELRAEFYGREV